MTHNSSLTTHYSQLITHYSQLITHYSQLITHHSSLITHYSLLLCLLVFPALEALAQEEAADAYARIAADIRPAVVTIVVYEYSGSLKHIGSGFFYTENGDIVTNSHVLVPNARAEIRTPDGKKYPVGAILERNEAIDIVKAQVHIPRPVAFLKPAAGRPAIGDRIMVAGSPMGLEQTMAEGIVSALRHIPGKGNVLQISAPISPGSSGGPVLNMAGEVVGVAAFQMIQGQSLNFAVPAGFVFGAQKPGAKKLKIRHGPDGALIIEQ